MRRPLIGWEDFEVSIEQRNKLKERSWRFTKGERSILCWGKGKGKEGMCEEKINSYVWKGVVHEKCVCKK